MERLLPSYPLWIIDPNFSVWSSYDKLNDGDATFWTGLSRKTYGLVRFDGITYSFLGKYPNTMSLEQISVEISSFSTKYIFKSNDFILNVEFVSPLLPTDNELLSCPVCYTKYSIETEKLASDFSISLILDEEYCYNQSKLDVVGGVLPLNKYEAAFMTLKRNLIMSNSNDREAPDWGDIYLCGDNSFFVTESSLNNYISNGNLNYIRKESERNYLISENKTSTGFFMIGFDDRVSIFYFGEWLKSLYFADGKTMIDALNYSYENFENIMNQLNDFDLKLKEDSNMIGDGYYTLLCASLRQSVGAHKLVKDNKGELLFLSKECASNGCIGTVDVSYPSIPLYLLYNPELVNAMMRGIFEFARKDVWNFDFPPHDLGAYPWCCGQVYGIKNVDDKYSCNMTWPCEMPIYTHTMLYLRPSKSNVYDLERQMPVEECGNMLIMTAGAIRAGASKKLALDNFDLLKKWVLYLEKYGLKPDNQLCTDDFAGHLANNVNLVIKALVGIEAFSIICHELGKLDLEEEYLNKAKCFSNEFKKLINSDVMPLSYDYQDTYSLKYNILFDKLFGFNFIGDNYINNEINHYIKMNNKYGVPLDTRADYTKSDWILWVAALTDDCEKTKLLYQPIIEFLKSSPERKPFADWFGTKEGEVHFFMNRTVQGGLFAPLLKFKNILNKNK